LGLCLAQKLLDGVQQRLGMWRNAGFIAEPVMQQQHPRTVGLAPKRLHDVKPGQQRGGRWRVGVPDAVIPHAQPQITCAQRRKQGRGADAVAWPKQRDGLTGDGHKPLFGD
jgi:hypothetical protein